ncbi:Zinc finger protein [Cercospora beticola]|uniref:C2H2 type master regulator of conidiophore development brlA n=1 Tax=Cercospora beticola TaxID=122368 RepID=A0A2G5I7J0_CERBT|nr:Zinc finger protein [Cercospora beticola]PIB00767.1 Zinc finger protein [Cercospora beticola]WPA96644.1 hypothetical protein RHO25_001251 [Cercospora beticola]CAK1355007.1 unnamed protein product [Cercospora beticola]
MIVDNVPIKCKVGDVGHSSKNGQLLGRPELVDVQEELRDFLRDAIEISNASLVFFTGPLAHESYKKNTKRTRNHRLYLSEADAQIGTGPYVELHFDGDGIHGLLTSSPHMFNAVEGGMPIAAALQNGLCRDFMYSLLERKKPDLSFIDLTMAKLMGVEGPVQIQKHFGVHLILETAAGQSVQSQLTKNAAVHSAVEPVKPFVCQECGKSFARRDGLTAHAIVHSSVKPFVCPKCGKSFTRQNNLSQHAIVHSGVKRFVCDVYGCGKSFVHRKDLTRHVKKEHANLEPFEKRDTRCKQQVTEGRRVSPRGLSWLREGQGYEGSKSRKGYQDYLGGEYGRFRKRCYQVQRTNSRKRQKMEDGRYPEHAK